MNECTYDKPDIRVGDLVKATSTRYEETVTGRVTDISSRGFFRTESRVIYFDRNNIEVLDRPLPEIPEELITGCRNVYMGLPAYTTAAVFYRDDWIKVINYLREHDTYNKESK